MSYPNLQPSGIGEAAKFNFSPWFIKLRFQDDSLIDDRNWKEATKPLSSIQSRIGNEFENRIYDDIETFCSKHVDSWFDWGSGKNKSKLIEEITQTQNANKPVMLTQARLSGSINEFYITGDCDLILLYPDTETDSVNIHVVDIKSSWDEKPHQQLQTSVYTILLKKLLDAENIDYNITGGIIYRETDIEALTEFDTAPNFDLRMREGDIKRILRDGGPFTYAFDQEFDDLPLELDENSPYSEVTTVYGYEKEDLSLIGLSAGEQAKLREFDEIETLEDIAMLYEPIENPKPYNYEEPTVNSEYEYVVNSLQENAKISERVSIICQKAQSLLALYDEDHEFAHDKPWMLWVNGCGNAELPEDDPPYDQQLPINRKSLIRVYLNVQYDHVRDNIIGISGTVDCSLSNRDITFSNVSRDIQRDPETWSDESLVGTAAEDILTNISMMADMSGQETPPIHLYVYSETEYEKLYEKLREHENASKDIEILRTWFDKREGIDQQMASVVETEIDGKLISKQFDNSVQNIYRHFYPDSDSEKVDDWSVSYESETIDLTDAFHEQMFNSYHRINMDDKTVGNGSKYANLVPRSGAQIPLEYLWGCEEIDLLDESWADKKRQKTILNKYRWATDDTRMSIDLYQLLTERLSQCLRHIERGLKYKNSNMHKEDIDLSNITTDINDLEHACRNYLDLESYQSRKDATEIYKQPLNRRILDGESVPIRLTNILEDEGYMFKAEGKLLYDEFGFMNPTEIAGSTKLSEESRRLASPIEKVGDRYTIDKKPYQIVRSTKLTVDSYEPTNNRIVVTGYQQGKQDEYIYTTSRPRWTTDENSNGQYIGEGEEYILDPDPDNSLAEKSLKALDHCAENKLYRDIENYLSDTTNVNKSMYERDYIGSYLDYIKDIVEFMPNKQQRKFILNTKQYLLLQGPPGTGKTSGSLAHNIVSRCYHHSQEGNEVKQLITGLSNKSVNEVMEDVSELIQTIDTAKDEHPFENVQLVRLAYEEPDDPVDGVEYIGYYEDSDVNRLRRMLMDLGSKQQTITGSDKEEHILLFTTPGRVESLMDKIIPTSDADEAYERAYPLFDSLIVDEASMMPINQVFLTSAFLKDDSQVLICGDHRQLPPVQKYEWSDEYRQAILEYAPYLSLLDYFRLLRGDEIDTIPDEATFDTNANIPLIQLEKTYRCHTTVTEFLQETIYDNDGIEYTSDIDDLIDLDMDSMKPGLQSILQPESPMTVVIHDDRKSRQVSNPEINLLKDITKEIPNKYTQGIVTPHNAQKGKLKAFCTNSTIDTVERFQGGEKDVMFMSTTVSDPSYLEDEDEFILSPNRLNVGLSRMKKKLIVLVPMSVFEMIPSDLDTYNKSRVWKSLYAVAASNSDPDWSGRIGDATESADKTRVQVYNIQ